MANSDRVRKIKEDTTFSRHGARHYSKTAEYQYKFKSTLDQKYGVTNPGQIESNKASRARKKQETFYNSMKEKFQHATAAFAFEEYTRSSDCTLRWSCKYCNLKFQSCVSYKEPKCPACFPKGNNGGQSSVEKAVLDEIQKFYYDNIVENSRKIIKPKELDLFFPRKKFALEINGIYWHSEKHVPANYHQHKYQRCSSLDIKLLMVTDHEWHTKKDCVLSFIQRKLGLAQKFYARKCSISEISTSVANEFFEKHHILGKTNATYNLGMFYNKTLISALSVTSVDHTTVEISRYSSAGVVVGGFARLIKVLKNQFKLHNIRVCEDLRYGTSDIYTTVGFHLVETTKPNYWYFLNNQMLHRLDCTKEKLVLLGYSKVLSEKEIMILRGAIRIYDCGYNIYELKG